MASLLWLVMLLPASPPDIPRPVPQVVVSSTERFLGQFSLNGLPLAVMSPTTVTLYSTSSNPEKAVPTPYHDIPDVDTELIEIQIDLRRRVILKMVYITKLEI